MSSRSHVDVNERRLRPLYDCLDSGNNKKAIQEADRLLKKQKDLLCVKALKSLALIRLGRPDETTATLQEVHAQHPYDEHTLQAMSMCYRDMSRLDLIAELYENAHKSKPDSEEILNALFMAYVRLGMYKKQQQVAMQLHKLRPQKNPYYFWAVMSIVMQGQEDEKLGKLMFLPLAEKMTLKYINEGKLEAEAEVRLFLIILQQMNKYQEALDVLKGPLAVKLTSEPDFPRFLEGELLTKLERWPFANAIYRRILLDEPDQWFCYKEYFSAAFHLIDSGWTPDKLESSEESAKLGVVDYTVEMMRDFINSQQQSQSSGLMRGPLLARLELMNLLKQRNNERWDKLFDRPIELVQDFLSKFGDKACCYLDIHKYMGLLSTEEQNQVLDEQIQLLGLSSKVDEPFVSGTDPKTLQRHITLLQLQRFIGIHHSMSVQQLKSLIEVLLKHYQSGLSLGSNLLPTDLQYADGYMLLVVHVLYDIYTTTRDGSAIRQAILLLEKALQQSPSNFQFKLLLVQLYARLGAVAQCCAFYDRLDVKHIQHDSLGYVISSHLLRLGHLSRSEGLFDSALRFFTSVYKDTSDYLISSYKYGSFPKVQEFVNFKQRLQNSLQFATVTVEKLLFDIVVNSESHKMTQSAVAEMSIDPLNEKTDFGALRDNRDCRVFQLWEPSDRLSMDDIQQQSFNEEKCWLKLRNLTARCVVAASRLGVDEPTPVVHDGLRNGTSASSSSGEVVRQLNAEMQSVLQEVSAVYGSHDVSKIPPLTGPFRSRLVPYLQLNLGQRFVDLVTALTCLDSLRDDVLSDKTECESSLSLPDVASLNQIKDQIGNNLPQSSDVQSLADVGKVENLVLFVDFVGQLTVVIGACHAVLKPVKAAISKRSKKRKESDPRVASALTFQNAVVDSMIGVTKLLNETFESILSSSTEVDSRLASVSLDTNATGLQRDEAAEHAILDKVRSSHQQTATEMIELLKRKLTYLDGCHI